jgi:O-acetyl-ADP-ribose deacetylase (regulator of RNase III)
MAEPEFLVGKARIVLVQGNIVDMDVDVVVNAANSSLMGGGGVDGAIHRAGGPRILEECKRIRTKQWPGGLPTGKAVVTSGGNLKARHVIHTVGPIWRGGTRGEQELLEEAYRNSLKLAVSNGFKSVAFPSISTGAYGYPVEKACVTALTTVKRFLEEEDELSKVMFVLFTAYDFEIYKNAARACLKVGSGLHGVSVSQDRC